MLSRSRAFPGAKSREEFLVWAFRKRALWYFLGKDCSNSHTEVTLPAPPRVAGLPLVTSLHVGRCHTAHLQILGRHSAGACGVSSCWSTEWSSSVQLNGDSISSSWLNVRESVVTQVNILRGDRCGETALTFPEPLPRSNPAIPRICTEELLGKLSVGTTFLHLVRGTFWEN